MSGSVSDEFARIERLREIFGDASPDVHVSIGDDGAVLAPSAHAQVLTVDTAVDNVHFRKTFASASEIGYRAYVCALSDLAAMGATPRSALVSLILPVDLEDDYLMELARGIAEASREYVGPVVGGNLSVGSELSITTTLVGEVRERVLTRSEAKPTDEVCVTGTVGSAAIGLALLERGDRPHGHHDPFVRRFMRPTARLAEGRKLIGMATSAIDVSDGLLQDLSHLCASSGVGARIYANRIPTDDGYASRCAELGLDPKTLALTGGEDYELLFTVPKGTDVTSFATVIGEMGSSPPRVEVIDEEGRPIRVARSGFRHFWSP